MAVDQCNWDEEGLGDLKTVFEDGKLVREQSLEDIRELVKQSL